jgi:hypothetical protein
MGIVSSIVTTKARDLHDTAIKLMAKWDPESVGEAQITEWDNQARNLARSAAKAQTDAAAATEALENIRKNIANYTAAAEKLAATNEAAANKAADAALEWQNKLDAAVVEERDSASWANEVKIAAERAQQLVIEGRDKIEKAKREQARATQEATVAASRRAERERMAGITKGLNGTDAVLDAMAANTKNAREQAVADNIRSGVLGKTVETDDAVKAALAEIEGGTKPKSLADKLAALKQK